MRKPCYVIFAIFGQAQFGAFRSTPSQFKAVRSECGQRPARSQPLLFTDETYPRDDELPAKVLYLGLDFAADVELVAVEGDALQVGKQVLLAGGVWALMGEKLSTEHFQAWPKHTHPRGYF